MDQEDERIQTVAMTAIGAAIADACSALSAASAGSLSPSSFRATRFKTADIVHCKKEWVTKVRVGIWNERRGKGIE